MARSTDCGPWSEEATHWWTLLHGEGVTAEERREFLSWVARSPERIEAYLGVERLMAALHSHQVRWPDTAAETLIREARASTQAAAGTIANLPGSRAAESPARAAPSERLIQGRNVRRFRSSPRGLSAARPSAGPPIVPATAWVEALASRISVSAAVSGHRTWCECSAAISRSTPR